MVTHLISGLNQGFPEIIFPTWSPKPSPKTPRRIIPGTYHEKHFFMEFSCMNEPLGRIVIKTQGEAGQPALEFEHLITGQYGYGYKGSRVYACCKNEWFLLGDLLYQNPPAQQHQNNEWDPRLPGGGKEEEDEGGGEGVVYRKLYRGSRRLNWEKMVSKQSGTPGAVVAVVSDYDIETGTWALGPQIKICLSDSLLRSGPVLGTVTQGMEVAQQLSRMGGRSAEPEARITISNCGALTSP